MGQGLIRMKKFDRSAPAEYAANAQKYIALMTQHIQKENNVLFSRLDRLLAKKKQKELVEGFEDLERKKIGEETHEEFHKLLFELKERRKNESEEIIFWNGRGDFLRPGDGCFYAATGPSPLRYPGRSGGINGDEGPGKRGCDLRSQVGEKRA